MLDAVGQGGRGLSGEAALRYLSRMAAERRAAGP
jgi:hypothetical protein